MTLTLNLRPSFDFIYTIYINLFLELGILFDTHIGGKKCFLNSQNNKVYRDY